MKHSIQLKEGIVNIISVYALLISVTHKKMQKRSIRAHKIKEIKYKKNILQLGYINARILNILILSKISRYNRNHINSNGELRIDFCSNNMLKRLSIQENRKPQV